MKFFIGAVVLLLGFLAFFFLSPRAVDLPQIGTVEEWPFTDAEGNEMSTIEKPKLVTFFFTNCPDVCPMTLFDLEQLQNEMESRGILEDDYHIMAVTLDPEYDTHERITQYRENLGLNSTNWVFARGSEEDTKRFTRYFNFVYEKDDQGFVTHSTSMYIVDSRDHIRAHHDMAIGNKRVNIEQIADHLESLIK